LQGRGFNRAVRTRIELSSRATARLGRFFRTTEQFWLNLQAAYDISRAKQRLAGTLKEIKPRPRHAMV